MTHPCVKCGKRMEKYEKYYEKIKGYICWNNKCKKYAYLQNNQK